MGEESPLRIGHSIREHPELYSVGVLIGLLIGQFWIHFPQYIPISPRNALIFGTLFGLAVAAALLQLVFWYLENVRQWEIKITKTDDFYD